MSNEYAKVGIELAGIKVNELASQHDDTFKEICIEEWGNQSDGNVEAPTGYFWLVEVADGSVDNQWQSFMESVQSELEKYDATFVNPDPGWYVVVQDNNGIWFVHECASELDARRLFSNLAESYNEWAGDDDV